MTDREFWQQMYRHYKGLSDTIREKHLGGTSDAERVRIIKEMGERAKAYVKEHPEVIRHGKYED